MELLPTPYMFVKSVAAPCACLYQTHDYRIVMAVSHKSASHHSLTWFRTEGRSDHDKVTGVNSFHFHPPPPEINSSPSTETRSLQKRPPFISTRFFDTRQPRMTSAQLGLVRKQCGTVAALIPEGRGMCGLPARDGGTSRAEPSDRRGWINGQSAGMALSSDT